MLLDISLPKQSGLWVLETLREAEQPRAGDRAVGAPGRVRQGRGPAPRRRRLRDQAVRAGGAAGARRGRARARASGSEAPRRARRQRAAAAAPPTARPSFGDVIDRSRRRAPSRGAAQPVAADPPRVRAAELLLPATAAACSRATSSCARCGACATPARRAPSTTSSRSCAPSWRPTPSARRHLLTVRGSGYRFARGPAPR